MGYVVAYAVWVWVVGPAGQARAGLWQPPVRHGEACYLLWRAGVKVVTAKVAISFCGIIRNSPLACYILWT